MNLTALYRFIDRHGFGVQASINAEGGPQAAVVVLVVTPRLELFFDTLVTRRKYHNLKADPRIAFVIGWDNLQTVQYEGVVDQPDGAELQELKRLYFSRMPALRDMLPGITYFRVRPTWIRFSDFRRLDRPKIVEFGPKELGELTGGAAPQRKRRTSAEASASLRKRATTK